MRPLEGITVVALEQAVAGPLATRHLADLGARVIKVERPGVGDFARSYDRTVHGESSYFVWLNRGKESIELDIKDAADGELLLRLIDEADVLVQNLLPGAVERRGLDAATLRRSRPDLVYCSISGYGAGGPYGDKKAYDLLVQCEAGLVDATGSPEAPAKVGISIADIATGMYAYSGILAALLDRAQTGSGCHVEVAMLDALGEWMTQPALYTTYGQRDWTRSGARHATISPYGPYRTADGGVVHIGVQSDREWALLCDEVLGRPELAEDPRYRHNTERVAHDAEMTPIIESALAHVSPDAAIERLEAIGIACARVRTAAELRAHPQLIARSRWQEIGSPGGPVDALLPPVTVAGREPVMGDVPALGQHNDALRREFAASTTDGAGSGR